MTMRHYSAEEVDRLCRQGIARAIEALEQLVKRADVQLETVSISIGGTPELAPPTFATQIRARWGYTSGAATPAATANELRARAKEIAARIVNGERDPWRGLYCSIYIPDPSRPIEVKLDGDFYPDELEQLAREIRALEEARR